LHGIPASPLEFPPNRKLNFEAKKTAEGTQPKLLVLNTLLEKSKLLMRAKSTKGNGAGAKRKRACYAQDAAGIKEGGVVQYQP